MEAIVIDASIAIAVAAKEIDIEAKAANRIAYYTARGCEFYGPGVLVSETLYVLCKKLDSGALSAEAHTQAVQDFITFASFLRPSPNGDFELIDRSESIRDEYTCRRTSDSIYVALAEVLAQTGPAIILTFDKEMKKQAVRHAPTVFVDLLE